MKALLSFEKSTVCHIPDDDILYRYRCENLKCYIVQTIFRAISLNSYHVTEFHPVSRRFTQIHAVSRRFTQFHADSRRFTQIHAVSRSFTQFHADSRSFTQIHAVSRRFTQFHAVSLGTQFVECVQNELTGALSVEGRELSSYRGDGRGRDASLMSRGRNKPYPVRFEGVTAVTMKTGVVWVVTPCGSCKNRRFGGTWRLLHQGDKNR
jgi:hypothetical protein